MSMHEPEKSLPKSWAQAAIDSALPKLPAGPTSLKIVAAAIAALAARLQEIKKFSEYDPREMKLTVLKTGYGVVDTLEGHTSAVFCLRALPDGRIVSGSWDNTLRIWSRDKDDTWSSEVLKGHTDFVLCLQALPDGRIVSGSCDKTLRIWSRDKNGSWSSEVLAGHTDRVNCLQALPDGRIVSGSGDKTIRIWDGTPTSGVS